MLGGRYGEQDIEGTQTIVTTHDRHVLNLPSFDFDERYAQLKYNNTIAAADPDSRLAFNLQVSTPTMVVAQSDVGRVFLQSIISRRVISDKLIRVLFRKSIEAVKGKQITYSS